MKKSRRLLFSLLSLLLITMFQPSYAKQGLGNQVQLIEMSHTLSISWADLALSGVDTNGIPIISGWESQLYQGYRLPMQLLSVEIETAQPFTLDLNKIEKRSWSQTLSPIPGLPPRTLMGLERPELDQAHAQLPSQPISLLRQSHSHGRLIAVLVLSPLFDAGNGPELAYSLQASIPAARQLDRAALQQELNQQQFRDAAASTSITAPAPQEAARQAFAMLRIQHRGMVRVSAASLAQAGIDLATIQPQTLQIFHNDMQIGIEIIGAADGTLDMQDEIRFFAPGYTDRWNKQAVYWLVQGSTAGQRIASRSVMPGAAPLSTVALEQGLWRIQRRYDSLLPGPVGDYWYIEDLRSGNGLPTAEMSLVLTPTLALAPGPITLTVYATAYTKGAHNLELELGGVRQSISGWAGKSNLIRDVHFDQQSSALVLRLIAGTASDGVEIQALAFVRPIQLNTDGRGALFSGYNDALRYQIQGATQESTLYDVSTPDNPIRLEGQYASGSYLFEDQGGRDYVLTGQDTLYDASVTKHSPADLRSDLHLQAIYIAPAAYQAALAPLIAYRNTQGIRAGSVDVQQIYNTWSGGHVSPNAIRDFLRYAYVTWSVPPQAFILVGDGSADPFDNLRHGANNVNSIPPYLAHVDPWVGETACDACYAQLDGASPLDELLPDLWFGRFPVKNPAELEQLVNKILRYEQAANNPAWQARIGLVADNYAEADGSHDNAGDFASMADTIAARTPQGIAVNRLYYDPGPARPIDQPWREPDEDRARQRTIDLINNGAALITYIGHSHQWQWAVTNQQSQTSSYLLGLYDADSLRNTGRLAVIRELTCLTAAFHTPAFSGTTIDERLLLVPGGAAAVWGSTGLGVAHGHDTLALGFDQALWSGNGQNQALGALTRAGLMELYRSSACCNDIFYSYVLFGDPLTKLRIERTAAMYMPLIRR